MGDEFLPDYTKYTLEELLDVYNRIDKVRNPIRTKGIEEELTKKLNFGPNTTLSDEVARLKQKAILNDEPEEFEKPSYERKIKRGWVAGITLATIILTFAILAINSPENSYLVKYNYILRFIDCIIVYGLTFGVYKKNENAAIFLLAVILLPGVIIFLISGDLWNFIIRFIFAYFIFEAIRGILEYQKINKVHIVN